MTFGKLISERRQEKGLSQKGLASLLKKEDGGTISPQYLNDIERGRRNPPPEYLLKQLAKHLDWEFDYLVYLAGKLPEDINKNMNEDRVVEIMKAFRKKKQDL